MKTVYTLAEVQKIKRKEQSHGIKSALEGIISAMCLELLDKQGLDRKQAVSIIRGTKDTFDSIHKGYLNIDDIKQTLRDEYDLIIDFT